jgi:hypothetical protein
MSFSHKILIVDSPVIMLAWDATAYVGFSTDDR